jgi:cytochrome c oxidase cbb3-type subunit I/II
MLKLRHLALGAGFLFATFAIFTQGILPAVQPQSRDTKVTRVVRTDLGQLKWTVADASDYTPLEVRGRGVYIREGCWYCHSQYVRPVTGETRRWGPVSQAGEYAFDQPHLFGTRRIGPDLTRVGLKYADEWHLAHFWDPRMLSPDSIMPSFRGLFDGPYGPVKIVEDKDGNRTLERSAASERLFDFNSKQQILLTPNAEGLTFVPVKDRYPVIFTPNKEYTGESVRLVAVTDDLRGLIAYVQKLGTNRGKWRDVFEPQRLEATQVSLPRSEEWIAYGKEVYGRRCAGCHGVKGDGNGPAATFLHQDRPRPFNFGLFEFRTTPSGSLPTDGDLLRTITRGVRGTAMPPWHMLPEKDRLAVIQYVKYELSVDRSDPDNPYLYFVEEPPEPPIYVANPPAPATELAAQGKKVWELAKCWECHGHTGKGDGEKAPGLKDDFGYPIPPANLTTGQFKSGPTVKDIFRTISTGLNGTPMPSYADSLSKDQRWALAYYILSLSAYTDPLSGQALAISAQDREALDNPELEADSSRKAYVPNTRLRVADHFAGEAWATKHGIDVIVAGTPASESTREQR